MKFCYSRLATKGIFVTRVPKFYIDVILISPDYDSFFSSSLNSIDEISSALQNDIFSVSRATYSISVSSGMYECSGKKGVTVWVSVPESGMYWTRTTGFVR